MNIKNVFKTHHYSSLVHKLNTVDAVTVLVIESKIAKLWQLVPKIAIHPSWQIQHAL